MVMSLDAGQLYALLPARLRLRDAENGSPLEALMRVAAAQVAVVEDNLRQLYDDEFIETCARWVIPYIGDLVGANAVYEIGGAATGSRAAVANTIAYRRRKGTLLALEQAAMDVSGRPAVAVEFFKRLITTESMRHVRPAHAASVSLRHGSRLDRHGAFDTLNRTIDVRRIAPRVRTAASPDTAPLDIALHGPGKYNIPDVGVYVWRWKNNSVAGAPAFMFDQRRYLFSPLGQNMPLFNGPPPRASFSGVMTRLDVPQPIRRREFFDQPADFYGSSMQLIADGAVIDVSQICSCDLSDRSGGRWGCVPKDKVAIDPELGRIQFGSSLPAPREFQVNYNYGFPADLGGGPYDRTTSLPAYTPEVFPFFAVAGSDATPTLEAAVQAWNAQPPGSNGMIVAPDFETLVINLTGNAAITVAEGSALWIVAARPSSPPIFSGSRAVLRGNVEVAGTGQLVVNGVWISGVVQVHDAANVQFSDCTLVPGISLDRGGRAIDPGEPSILASAPGAAITLLRTISGPIAAAEGSVTRICSSIVDAGSPCGIAYAAADMAGEGADLHIEDSTVIGKVHTRTMEIASNTIFLARRPRHDSWKAAIWCGRKQAGCMRFCFVPADAITPRRYRCLPGDDAQESALRPQFITLQYGHPSYGLLSGNVPMAVWSGADNGSQMGVYKFLEETEAARNVQLRTPEFLPFNLEAGVFLVPSETVAAAVRPDGYYGYNVTPHADPCGDAPDDELWHIGVGAHLI
jgi:hypothetical protein